MSKAYKKNRGGGPNAATENRKKRALSYAKAMEAAEKASARTTRANQITETVSRNWLKVLFSSKPVTADPPHCAAMPESSPRSDFLSPADGMQAAAAMCEHEPTAYDHSPVPSPQRDAAPDITHLSPPTPSSPCAATPLPQSNGNPDTLQQGERMPGDTVRVDSDLHTPAQTHSAAADPVEHASAQTTLERNKPMPDTLGRTDLKSEDFPQSKPDQATAFGAETTAPAADAISGDSRRPKSKPKTRRNQIKEETRKVMGSLGNAAQAKERPTPPNSVAGMSEAGQQPDVAADASMMQRPPVPAPAETARTEETTADIPGSHAPTGAAPAPEDIERAAQKELNRDGYYDYPEPVDFGQVYRGDTRAEFVRRLCYYTGGGIAAGLLILFYILYMM